MQDLQDFPKSEDTLTASGNVPASSRADPADGFGRAEEQFWLALANLVHDLQNVLWPAAVQAEVAAEDVPRMPPSRETLEQIGRSVRDAMEIVAQLDVLVKHRANDHVPLPLTPATTTALQVVATKYRILCVGNDAKVLSTIACLLGHLGHDVDQSGSGAEALELFATRHYDVVMTDVDLVDMDGREVTRRIRGCGSTPVIWLADVDIGGNAMSIDEAPQCVIRKPLSLSALRQALAGITGH